jgi:energy-coupling factor transporter ATP-binding protein EcfA2
MSKNAAKPDVSSTPPAESTPLAPPTPPALATLPSAAPPTIPASLSTLTQPLAALPPEPEIERVPLGRLSAVEIRNYRAYRGTFRLELPKGENLLIYGENGAGKSSLFHTLKTFLEAPDLRIIETEISGRKLSRPIKVTDSQHRFTTENPEVKLEFGQRKFAWTSTQNDTGHAIVRSLNKGKAFLDYKSLLGVHYVRPQETREIDTEKQDIDLFLLLIEYLLPHYTYSYRGTDRTFKERWDELNKEVRRTWRWSRRQKEPEKDFLADLEEFNQAFDKAVSDLAKQASMMLEVFKDDFQVDLRFQKGVFKRDPKKRIEGPKVLAIPAFRKLQCRDYPIFLNEARLSALAICLFLGAVKNSPATGLRLMVLDDILIGLDMTNRVKVMDLIQEYFKNTDTTNWQIIILTYSKAWFERLKDHFHKPDVSPPWKSVVLWEDWRAEDSSPHSVGNDVSPHTVADGSGTLLEMADRHLEHKDYKAAAVYARSALEAICNHTCSKANLSVIHVSSPKERKVEHYIEVLETRLGQLKKEEDRKIAIALIGRLREAQAFVLNRNSHFDVEEEDPLSGEVRAAIQTVKDLTEFFEKLSWRRAAFDGGQTLTALERLRIDLAEARKLARFGPKEEAIRKLSAAHHSAWEYYGQKERVALPIGTPLNAKLIWTAALSQTKLDATFDLRLKAARPYLFGCVNPADFASAKFEEAAKLLDELCPPPAVTAPPNASITNPPDRTSASLVTNQN